MKCAGCGYVSLERVDVCNGCGAPLSPPPVPRPPLAEIGGRAPTVPPGTESRQLDLIPDAGRPASQRPERGTARRTGRRKAEGRDGERAASRRKSGGRAAEPDDPGLFRIDEEFIRRNFPDETPGAAEAEVALRGDPVGAAQETAVESPGAAFVLREEDLFTAVAEPAAVGPVVEPERMASERAWMPEIAGFGPRAAAVLADQAILAAVLGVFVLAALLALRLSGFETSLLTSSVGLRASLTPFALLAVVLSFCYHTYFHGSTGRTPGKALAGIEVRTLEGEVPGWPRAGLRWLVAALGLACAGVGLASALFDPGRRSWADRVSGTVVAVRRHHPAGPPRR